MIERGRRYIRRDGTISQPLLEVGQFLLDPGSGFYFSADTEDGHLVQPDFPPHAKDLIEEFRDEL